ncbi:MULTISPECIES: class I SAM-dependent methyltransferase [Aminobacter]|nr:MULTISPECIES: class I SAM-dependent methyltransferase [Aminobacter]MRX36706.1 methyltransferase domain-containing protein [Aminobacter sp. MDW-2]QNH33848.1 class I SAM-dependent methyltransferase [Aminobacter sp. MDW-2]
MLSSRLRAIVDALPLRRGMRILEIGCGTGAMAREISERIGDGYVLGIDRSGGAIAKSRSIRLAPEGGVTLEFKCISAEEFELPPGEDLFDLAVAIRVGAFDGRYPEVGRIAIPRIFQALKDSAKFFVDGGTPIKELYLTDSVK